MVSEEKIFEIVDDGRTPEHGYSISSPGEPVELKSTDGMEFLFIHDTMEETKKGLCTVVDLCETKVYRKCKLV